MRIVVSRCLNRLFMGHPEELFCARVYNNHKKGCKVSTVAMVVLDQAFAWQEDQHCRRCAVWQHKEKRNVKVR